MGKSTNIAALQQSLEQAGIDLLCTREPGGTPLAEEIRALLLNRRDEPVHQHTELLLMFAARVQHYRTVIEPALESGRWVLCDRFVDATIAYQGHGRGAGEGIVVALHEMVLDACQPDLTVLLDLPPTTGRARVAQRGEPEDRFESERDAFFERVRAGYLSLAERNPARFRVIDAGLPLAEVESRVRAVIRDYLIAEGLH